ncbi:MAG: hypothetical protein US30_C0012G0019 [Candidatus Moranbacteria bacterium GW2011_GWF2_36_839]|nr:MAG: hypothetical protein US27_C0015G0008 [Candidatus Moranbacteria bacterium GW2011_GWF1_36_78]KKQ16709.1 MAG: hypothetical protein US30_C0012G0019 [Candidatus Moranbacteria bacterium GW2011_GWF2_36_839]HAT74223.1 hypothetical protein [Candidatus Moranbacteria bacterium]HBY11409.1 hypothetical protein [Candidatus Moranbacteria bacterium]
MSEMFKAKIKVTTSRLNEIINTVEDFWKLLEDRNNFEPILMIKTEGRISFGKYMQMDDNCIIDKNPEDAFKIHIKMGNGREQAYSISKCCITILEKEEIAALLNLGLGMIDRYDKEVMQDKYNRIIERRLP